jgi:methyl-accepting chemotaxis protein
MSFSIRTKLLGGFGLVLGVLLISTVLALSALSRVNDEAETLGQRDLAAVESLGAVDASLNAVRAAQMGYVTAEEAEDETGLKTVLDEATAGIDEEWAHYEHTIVDAENRRRFDATKKEVATYLEKTAPFFALAEADRHDAALEVLNSQNQEYQDARATLGDSLAFNVEIADADVAEAASAYSGARTQLLIVAGVSLLLAAGIAFLLARQITGGVGQMLRAAEGISEGDVDQQVTLASRDELGRTAGAFRRMIEYLKEMAGAADRVAAGDLTVLVEPKSDRDALGNALSGMTVNLRELIGSVSESSGNLSAASQEMASTSDEAGRAVGEIASAVGDVAQGAERQVRMVESARESAQEAARAATISAERAQETAGSAEQAREVARDGVRAAEQATGADPRRGRLVGRGRVRDRGPVGPQRADRRDRGHHHRHRRADQPARAQRRHRGRPCRRAGPRLRGRGRGSPQAGRGVPGRRRPDLRDRRRGAADLRRDAADGEQHRRGRRRGRAEQRLSRAGVRLHRADQRLHRGDRRLRPGARPHRRAPPGARRPLPARLAI